MRANRGDWTVVFYNTRREIETALRRLQDVLERAPMNENVNEIGNGNTGKHEAMGPSLADWHAEQMDDAAYRVEYERLGPAHQVAHLRMERGLTQRELAKRVGTRQSSISRLESGRREPSLSFLRRVVEALDGHLEITIRPQEEVVAD
jgi:DNA-binding XRE family transcriptional regulator